MQIPSNMFLTRTRASIYMPVCSKCLAHRVPACPIAAIVAPTNASTVMGWAVISACTALVQNFGGLVACRFFLGFVEAPFYPGVLYLLSIFYTRKELASRIAIMYTGQIVANGTAGLIAAAVFSTLDGAHNISGWRWLFIIEGVTTFGVAAIALFLMPDEPGNTRWLTPRERELAVRRIERDIVGLAPRGSTWSGFKQAVRDPKTWLFILMQNLHISACSFTFFFPTIVKSMGFTSITALLLTAPPYFISGIFGIVLAWTSGRLNERTWHITGTLLLAIVGFVISVSTLNTAARYVASILFATGAFGVGSVILGWVSAVLSETPEKKAVVYSMVNVGATIAYLYTAYLWPASDGPRYLPGFIAMAAFAGGSLLCAWAMRIWLMALNKKLRAEGSERNVYAY